MTRPGMIKVIIQIPCYNEEATLGVTLDALPRELPGVDVVEWLVIDDGSVDGTVEVARRHGVDHIHRVPVNRGLANAFREGLKACLAAGADIIVNTDADNQYEADDIPLLVAPILEGRAEMVVGSRPIVDIEHFSPLKKRLQALGSWVVRTVSNTDVADAPSGFRAISRRAAMQLNVLSAYTYTLETIIQAGQRGIAVTSVPVRTNAKLRESRLMRSMSSYVYRSLVTIVRIFMTYQPGRFFFYVGSVPFTLGMLLSVRWLWLFFAGAERSHVPSLVLAAVLLLMGFQLWLFGLFSELSSTNRKLLEDIQVNQRLRLYDRKD